MARLPTGFYLVCGRTSMSNSLSSGLRWRRVGLIRASGGGTRRRAGGGLGEEFVVAADGLDEADGDHVGEDGGAAVGDEREREAGDRHDADGHADVDERLEEEPDRDPGRHQHAEHVVGDLGGADRAEDDDAEQGDDGGRADEAEFLARDGEDEVGLAPTGRSCRR